MKKNVCLLAVLALLLAPAGLVTAAEQGGEAEPVWSAGTVTEYVEGSHVTISAPEESEGGEKLLTFTFSEDTEFYGEVAVGMKVEVEHLENNALYIQPAEEEGS